MFFASADRYLRLIHEHFDGAGIEFDGERCHTLRHRPVARSLRRLLSIDTDTLPRRTLLSILSERVVTWYYGTPIAALPLRRVERLTRARIKIVGGSDWERLTELNPEDPDATVATALHSLVTTLRDDLNAVVNASTWAEASRCVIDVLGRYSNNRSKQPDDPTTKDLRALATICLELSELDGVAPPPTLSGIANAISVRIDTVPETVGTTTSAVTVGPLAAGAGRDFDVCIDFGAAEGAGALWQPVLLNNEGDVPRC